MDLNLSDICISTIFLLSILYIFGLIKCYSKLPPGPFGLPILGYLPFINPVKPHETISELVTKYGKIFSMQMGQILCIVLADPEIIRTVFSKSKFQLNRISANSFFFFFYRTKSKIDYFLAETSGRAPLFLTHGIMNGYGLICAQGER